MTNISQSFRWAAHSERWLGGVVAIWLIGLGSGGAVTNEIQYLSGTDKDHTVPWDFRVSAGRNSGFWTNIPVPSCWDTKGFGSYEYGNDNTSEFGEYRRQFTVPADWKNKRVFLVYEGSMTDTETKINGLAPGETIGSSGLRHERAFNNTATSAAGMAGGVAASAPGNGLDLGTRASFTLTGWIKPESDFSAIPNSRYPRIISVGATPGYDGTTTNGAFLIMFHDAPLTRALQFKVHADPNAGAISTSNVLTGNDWTFVAVTYDSTLRADHVKFYVGNRAAPLPGAVSTVTYPRGAVHFGAEASAYLLNRSDRGRAFDGWGDDFRIFNGALPPDELEAVRASGLRTNAPPPAPLYQWNFNHETTSAVVRPEVGGGGALMLLDAAGAGTDSYTAIGRGVSGTGPVGTGLHQGSFYEFSYEVTSNLRFGAASNLLEATVRKKSANTSINQAERQADYWTFGGIYRPVYLEARPWAHVERIATDAKADGQIAVHTFLSGLTNDYTVTARVTDAKGNLLGDEFSGTAAAGAANVILNAALPAPQTWSPEFPNLYKLSVELRDGATVIHSRTETIGFRTVTFTNSIGFFLNGKKVMMRGVNRHDFWPDSGRTTSRAVSIADIELMKSMNLNAVRMSHYPPMKHFLEECDRLGLLVINELGGWQSPPYDNTIAPGLVRELVIRDVNHPCIFVWANGNEGGFNRTVLDHYGRWDPQNRKVIQPANWESELTGGVRTHHYASYSAVTNYLGAGKPVYMPTEIQHGLYDGGGGAGLEDHWKAMLAAPNSAGMFIWALLDECVRRDDQGGALDGAGDQAPDGILGPYREKEASYYTVKALWSPVQITAPNPATFSGTLALENRFDFTSLDQCTFRWELGWYPNPNDPTNALNKGFLPQVSSSEFAGPALAPGAAGQLTLNVPTDWAQYDALRVTARDPHRREIYTWIWPLSSAAPIRDRVTRIAATDAAPLTAGGTASGLSVTNGPRVFRFDLNEGRLLGATISGQPLSLANGPRPVAGSWSVTNVSHGFVGGEYVITVNDVTAAADGFQWRIRSNGWVNLRYRYTLTGPQSWLGVTFDYPETNVIAMRWLGQGPYRVWKNRLAGQEVAVHYKTANNTDTGKQWGYPEFRGYHGQLHWAALDTTQSRITLVTPTSNLFFRVLTPPVASVSRPGVSPAFPPGNVSLLHAVNAIGHKFGLADTGSTGPASAKPVATGLYTGEVDFYFGALPTLRTDRDGSH